MYLYFTIDLYFDQCIQKIIINQLLVGVGSGG